MSVRGRRVVVTGMGALCSIGHDVPSFHAALKEGRVGIGPIANIPTERLNVRVAAEIHGLDMTAHFRPRQLPVMDRTAQLGVIAAREAMAQAGLRKGDVEDAAVILGAGIGQEAYDSSYLDLYGRNLPRVHPFTVMRIMPNAAASLVSMEFGIHGPVYAMASACASANHAIGQAAQMIRAGTVDVALAGGADAPITVGFMKGWEAIRVLSADGCRPFSRDRTGLSIGEGAAVFVLEDAERAAARGVPALMEIAGFGMSADAADITAPDATGAARAMRMALRDAGCGTETVQYVNAHGTGTKLNDKTEVAALRQVFGPALDRMSVSSTKSMIGHCMTAGGALELAATAMAFSAGYLPPTARFNEPDPDCDVDCIPNEARRADIEVAMSNAFAFGGLNAVLVVRRA